MVEILPIKLLTQEDSSIFGNLNISLAKLQRSGINVAPGIIITPPELKLKTILEHFNFGKKEVFEQTLTLVKKEINQIPAPEILKKEVENHNLFFLAGQSIKGVNNLWIALLHSWLEEIKSRIWKEGFYKGLTEELEPKSVVFIKKIEAFGVAYFDPASDDVMINVNFGQIHPNDSKKIVEMVNAANKKLFIPHQYEWIIDGGVKFIKILPYTLHPISPASSKIAASVIPLLPRNDEVKSSIKIFLDLSQGLTIEKNVDGVYISSEKIFDLNKPRESFENTIFKLVESAITFPNSPILFKLADISEGMGKVRGTLRLLHQKSLFDPLIQILDFARHKKSLMNVHIVIPFVRSVTELMSIKRELAVKKLSRKSSLQLWLEIAVPENIINLEEYLISGVDGVVLNLDELISLLSGFDYEQQELSFYKKEVKGLIKFLGDGIKILNKARIPFVASGSLTFYPEVLEFLVEKGVFGVVVERYEVPSIKDLLHQTERRMILRRS